MDLMYGNRLHNRTVSLSSVASSSLAATSVMGDLSDSSLTLADENSLEYSPPPPNEVDRYGFTGGSQYTDPGSENMTVQKIRSREQKWLTMLNNWDKWMARRFPQVKNRCRKGIPASLRGRAWQLLSGSKSLLERNEGKYEEFLVKEADSNCLEDIEKDLHRQFPFHEMFLERGGNGQQDLRNVLRAYSVYNPEDGYCQAQAPLAAVLLMHMPAEQAFWCMVAMCEHYLQGYFSPGLEAIQVDGYVMQSLLRKVSPIAHKHLDKQGVSPVLYMTEWFMCVFSRTLPWTSVLRLWDMFFCEGIKVVFRCGLVLLRSTLGNRENLSQLSGLYETMESLRKINPDYMLEQRLMFEIVNLKINEQDLEHEHKLQRAKWKKDPSTAPPIANLEGGKRVYRYTPTFHKVDHSGKHRSKSKNKSLSKISANSSFILQQTQNHNLKKKEKKKNEDLSKTVEVNNSEETSMTPNDHENQEDSVNEPLQESPKSVEPENIDLLVLQEETVVTGFTAQSKSSYTSEEWEQHEKEFSDNPKLTDSNDCENRADEITVF